MPYALNIKKGTKIHNADIGELEGGIAVPIDERQKLIAKHLIGVVVFDSIAGITFEKAYKGLYGTDYKVPQRPLVNRRYTDFVSEYKDVTKAKGKWEEYKSEVKKRIGG